jgi:hypothetical protein
MLTVEMDCANTTSGAEMAPVIMGKHVGTVQAIAVCVPILGAGMGPVMALKHATNVWKIVAVAPKCHHVETESVMETRTAIHALEIARSPASCLRAPTERFATTQTYVLVYKLIVTPNSLDHHGMEQHAFVHLNT